MPETVEIGLGRSARRGYYLDDVALVPTRRTRGSSVVSTTWQIDAHTFALPLVVAPSDAVVSPETAVADRAAGRPGGARRRRALGALRRPGRRAGQARHATPRSSSGCTRSPVSPDLLRAAGARSCARPACGSPSGSRRSTPPISPRTCSPKASTCWSSRARSSLPSTSRAEGPGLNLKTFIADLDVPVLVGGCTNYQTALHLMRTGAAGVIVGYGAHLGSTTHSTLGIDVPMATALVDAAAARRDYLDETGGRYVHLVAYGDIDTGADIAKALACGADAVMLGEALAIAAEAPGGGRYWDATAAHPRVPRSAVVDFTTADDERPPLEELLLGPTSDPSGERNLFGAVRRAMGKCGYSTLKEFQKAELIVTRRSMSGYSALATRLRMSSSRHRVAELLDPGRGVRLRLGVRQRSPAAVAPRRRPRAVRDVMARRARRPHRADHDGDVRAHPDVPLPPGDRRAGVRDAGLPVSRDGSCSAWAPASR